MQFFFFYMNLIQILYIHKNVPQGKIHTHFIFIDDGSENKFGGEIEFRSRLEKFISEQRVDPHDKDSCEWLFYAHVGPLIYRQRLCCTWKYSCVKIYSELFLMHL